MKLGKTLGELAAVIEHQSQEGAKVDYGVDTNALQLQADPGDGHVSLVMAPDTDRAIRLGMNTVMHEQLRAYLDISAPYYNKCRDEDPELLAINANRWLKKSNDQRMVRSLLGTARAFMSLGYRPLDNTDLAQVVLPVLAKQKLKVLSAEITERKLYIKACDPRGIRAFDNGTLVTSGEHVAYGDVVPCITVSNSEVGCGRLTVEPGYFSHKCKNMHIFAETIYRRIHIGARVDMGEELYAMLSERTKRTTDAAIWSQVGDVVEGAFNPEQFDQRLNVVRGLTAIPLTGDPVKIIKVTGEKLKLNEGERTNVLRHLIEGGDLSAYGLMNAITRTAEDAESYDRATEIEGLGGSITVLPQTDWARIASAN